MNKRILFALLFVFIIPTIFAVTDEISIKQNSYFKGEVSTYAIEDLEYENKDFRSWKCDFNLAKSTVMITESCFCIDTKGNYHKGIGYGNIYECLESTGNVIQIKTDVDEGLQDSLELLIEIKYDTKEERSFSEVSISSNDNSVTDYSEIECDDSNVGDKEYIIYRVNPFSIIGESSDKYFNLEESLIALYDEDEIKCRIDFYENSNYIGTEESSNSLKITNKEVDVIKVYLAPAFPIVNENLFCYAYSHFSFDNMEEKNIAIQYNISFMKEGTSIQSFAEENQSGVPKLYVANISLATHSKGDNITCLSTIKLINKTDDSILSEDSVESNPVIIVNSMPHLENLMLGVIRKAQFRRESDIIRIYSDEGEIVVLTDKGDAEIKGNFTTGTATTPLIKIGKSVFGADGNHYYSTEYTEYCHNAEINIRGASGDTKMSIGSDGSLCYEGYLFEEGFR